MKTTLYTISLKFQSGRWIPHTTLLSGRGQNKIIGNSGFYDAQRIAAQIEKIN